jgi:hypothetical protein
MFNQTAKTKGKTAEPLPIPSAKKKASKSPAAHRRGHVAPQAGVKPPKAIASEKTHDESPADSEANESGVEPGELEEEHENEGGPCIDNIENAESIADAVKSLPASKRGKKYDSATNTYR